MNMSIISLYPKIIDVKNGRDITLDDFLQKVKDGYWQDEILKLRTLKTKEEISQTKKSLPYVTISGKFKERNENGIALIFARTETAAFFNSVWKYADSILFIKGRLTFYYIDGSRARANSGAPSVLISYDQYNSEILKKCGITGQFISLK